MTNPAPRSVLDLIRQRPSVPLFGILLVLLIIVAWLDVRPSEPVAWMLFLGRFHPLIVHLPIGFLTLGLVFTVVARRPDSGALAAAIPLTLWLSTLSAIGACIMGFLLSTSGDYDPSALFWHQWLGIGIGVATWIAYVLHVLDASKATSRFQPAYWATLALASVFLVGGGHFGGTLTHGSTYLTQYMPNPLRALAGLPPREEPVDLTLVNVQEAVVFQDIIHPILEARCVTCHNPNKNKGSLRLDTIEGIQRGGESGPIIEAGFAATSELHRRLILPADDEYRMPPDGRRPLTDAQVALIAWWLDEGASFEANVATLTVPEDIQTILDNLAEGGSTEPGPTGIFALDVLPPDPSSVTALRDLGVSVLPIATEVPFVQVDFVNAPDSLLDEQVAALQSLAPNIAWMDVAGTNFSDEHATILSAFPHITRLHLEKTQISDAALAHLANAEHLEYLNVYATDVSDAGLRHLEGLGNLTALYAWQTSVTETGANQLQDVLPALQINLGISDFSPVPPAETD